jgi:hypothetical protein
MASLYSHCPVGSDEIRLLHLQPGHECDPLCGTLSAFVLSQAPEFEAVSYVWGKSIDGSTISIGVDNLAIPKNLDPFLRRLRHTDRTRVLWVDSICIDQTNIPERNSQVKLMGDIYSRASAVTAWIRPDTPADCLRTLDFIKGIAQSREQHWSPLQDPDSPLTLSGLDFLSVMDFFKQQWWMRMWTLQEAVLAKQLILYVGDVTLPWDVVAKFTSNFVWHAASCCSDVSKKFFIINDVLHRLSTVEDLEVYRDKIKKGTSIDFCQLIAAGSFRDATDPRDKIYAVLGLTGGLYSPRIDYSLDVTTVYKEAAVHAIERSGTLDIFSMIGASPRGAVKRPNRAGTSHYHCPSWTSDWSTKLDILSIRLQSEEVELLKLYNASGSARAIVSQRSPAQLDCQGAELDVIQVVGNPMGSLYETGELRAVCGSWRKLTNIDRDPEKTYVGGGTWIDAFWRTLCFDNIRQLYDVSRATDEDACTHDLWWFEILSGSHSSAKISVEGDENKGLFRTNVDGFGQSLWSACCGRSFFVTKKGYMGLGPASLQVGDSISVLLGGKMFYALRPVSEDGEKTAPPSRSFSLLGTSYVHGMMDGEVMKMVEDHTLQVETFTLV